MNVTQLLALARAEMKDQALPYLWSDVELIAYAAQAQDEAARRIRGLFDGDTPAICQIKVTAGQPLYPLDPRILFIERVKLASQPIVLPKCDRRDLDSFYWGWETMPASIPVTWFMRGYRQLRLVPASKEDDTLNLEVLRLPKYPLAALTDTPELDPRFHHALVYWILHRAFGKQDSQSNDPQKSATALAQFEREFGPPSNARDELWIERRHGIDPYEGIY